MTHDTNGPGPLPTRSHVKRALADGRPLLGCWAQLFHPAVAEMMGLCGYDLVLCDMEHGLGSVQQAAEMLRAIRGTGADAFVRLPSNDAVILKTLMDQGVDGVMIPMVESVDAARSVVAACRYPPKGSRGLAIGVARGSDYGIDPDYVARVEADTTVICQIETVLGVRNARAIAEVDGVDMLFIGRNDLAADSGHMLDLDHPDVDALMAEVVAAARAAGKRTGTVPSAGRDWKRLLDDGFDLVIPSSDIAVLRQHGQDEVRAFRSALGLASAATVSRGY